MRLKWLYHTGFVVSDMERSLAFYRGLLGMKVERSMVVEGDFISQVVGYSKAKLNIVFLGVGDMRHALELIQYLNPPGMHMAPISRNDVGAAHLGIVVEDLDTLYQELAAKGVSFVSPPAFRDAPYPWARKACYLQDPDGNWLEFIERAPAPPGATQV
jgi:catechol 2,3-dioxygenase-like lactoylglutathione lyase family enzyme